MELIVQRWLFVVFAGLLVLTGCNAQELSSESPDTGTNPTETATGNPDPPVEAAPAEPPAPPAEPAAAGDRLANFPRLEGEATVEMVVNGTPILIQIDGTQAPITAGNFVDLVQRGVYDDIVFHRVVRDPQPFVAQAGDPQSKDPNVPVELLGTGGFQDPETGAPRNIPLEITPEGEEEPVYSQTFEEGGLGKVPALRHTRGAIAMARSQFPDSASSQFYFTLADLEFLDGNYAVFGYVIEGMEGVDGIQQGDRIESATVVEGIENFKPVQ